jgi:hypothetical protein
MDGDIEAGVAHRLAGRAETAGVAQLGPDDHRQQGPDAVVGGEGTTAGLASAEAGELSPKGFDELLQVVDHGQASGDDLSAGGRDVGSLNEGPALGAEHGGLGRGAVVEQHGVDAQLPHVTFVREGPIQTSPGSRIGHVGGRDPRLGQAVLAEQFAQVASIGPVRLGPALLASQGSDVGRLGQVSLDTGALELLDHKAPTGAAFHCESGLVALEARQPLPQALTGGRSDPASLDLAGLGVEIVESDLPAMHVKSTYDRHGTSSRS